MSAANPMILVSSDAAGLLLELLGKARQVADSLGWQVGVLSLSQDLALDVKALGEAGADTLYQAEGGVLADGNPDNATALLTEVVRQTHPTLVLVGATKQGMEVAPRVAERLGAGYGAWTNAFEIDPTAQTVQAQCGLYTGQGLATYQFKTETTILSCALGVFKGLAGQKRTAQVVALSLAQVTPRIQVVAYHPKGSGSSRIEEARAVVDVGQGVKQREDLQLIESVAGLLDAQLACSRPVASDRDWFSEWLGLSGKKVSPELCLTVGISGAVQHIVGIRDSRVIVAVNSDENASIFSQVDYGVVADLYAFLPVLIERLQARKATPAWK